MHTLLHLPARCCLSPSLARPHVAAAHLEIVGLELISLKPSGFHSYRLMY